MIYSATNSMGVHVFLCVYTGFFTTCAHTHVHIQSGTCVLYTCSVEEAGAGSEKYDPNCAGQLGVSDITWLTVRGLSV